MRSRSTLVLMELVVMVLVFALTGALCLRAFTWADRVSQAQADRGQALLCAQNGAQLLKSCRGDFRKAAQVHGLGNEDRWVIHYSEDWQVCNEPGVFRLQAARTQEERGLLGGALIEVYDAQETLLAQLKVKWQEVDGHG